MNLKHRPHYWEENKFIGTNTIQQKVYFDRRKWTDASACQTVIINIRDSLAFKNKRTINIETDTLIAQCLYNFSSPLCMDHEYHRNITGKLTLINWDSTRIKVSMDLIVKEGMIYNDCGNPRYDLIYKGTRTFKK